jgi:SAM-dependent methyltransferase
VASAVATTPYEDLATKLETSLLQEPPNFVRFTLTNNPAPPKDASTPVIEKLQARLVASGSDDSQPPKFQIVYTHPTSTTTKNYALSDAAQILRGHLASTGPLKAARLFTTAEDWVLEVGKSADKARLYKNKATFTEVEVGTHDRQKKRRLTLVPLEEEEGKEEGDGDEEEMGEVGRALLSKTKNSFLHEYEILGQGGRPKAGMKDKFRQIEKFIEILASLLKEENDNDENGNTAVQGKTLTLLDAGCGKGYLTFAAFEYLTSQGWQVEARGVDVRQDVVDKANAVADRLGYSSGGGLTFSRGTIAEVTAKATAGEEKYDVVIALHACDTATDDCLYLGVQAGAKVILASPCCHKEVRREMKKAKMMTAAAAGPLQPVLKHGILMERQAEIVTDRYVCERGEGVSRSVWVDGAWGSLDGGEEIFSHAFLIVDSCLCLSSNISSLYFLTTHSIRVLALQLSGYQAQVFEWINDEETSKNLMLTATKRQRPLGAKKLREFRGQLRELMNMFGLGTQHLLGLLEVGLEEEEKEETK